MGAFLMSVYVSYATLTLAELTAALLRTRGGPRELSMVVSVDADVSATSMGGSDFKVWAEQLCVLELTSTRGLQGCGRTSPDFEYVVVVVDVGEEVEEVRREIVHS